MGKNQTQVMLIYRPQFGPASAVGPLDPNMRGYPAICCEAKVREKFVFRNYFIGTSRQLIGVPGQNKWIDKSHGRRGRARGHRRPFHKPNPGKGNDH